MRHQPWSRAFAAATVRDQNRQVGLVAGQTLTGLSEIGNLLVTTRDGRPVYVRDVARIVLATETAETRVAHLSRNAQGGFDRAPAVSLAIAKRAGANAVTVAHDILAAVKRLEGGVVPSDVAIHVTRDYGETANEKANELLFHLALATISIVAAGLAGDRLARGAGGGHRHSGDDPADALCGTA